MKGTIHTPALGAISFGYFIKRRRRVQRLFHGPRLRSGVVTIPCRFRVDLSVLVPGKFSVNTQNAPPSPVASHLRMGFELQFLSVDTAGAVAQAFEAKSDQVSF
jgi:hypothetical protein